jgi:hypothetical protein
MVKQKVIERRTDRCQRVELLASQLNAQRMPKAAAAPVVTGDRASLVCWLVLVVRVVVVIVVVDWAPYRHKISTASQQATRSTLIIRTSTRVSARARVVFERCVGGHARRLHGGRQLVERGGRNAAVRRARAIAARSLGDRHVKEGDQDSGRVWI